MIGGSDVRDVCEVRNAIHLLALTLLDSWYRSSFSQELSFISEWNNVKWFWVKVNQWFLVSHLLFVDRLWFRVSSISLLLHLANLIELQSVKWHRHGYCTRSFSFLSNTLQVLNLAIIVDVHTHLEEILFLVTRNRFLSLIGIVLELIHLVYQGRYLIVLKLSQIFAIHCHKFCSVEFWLRTKHFGVYCCKPAIENIRIGWYLI